MTETPPDPADVHTGTDRVELTKDERLKIGAEVAGFLAGTRIVGPDLAMQSVTPGLARAVESIVAARLQALAAELRQSATVELTRVHQELASANARCAELEEEIMAHQVSDGYTKGYEHGTLTTAKFKAERDALQETLDRVTAEVARMEHESGGWMLRDWWDAYYRLRAALTPEGTE